LADKYDVIVVGAGHGGTGCAALLALEGLKVLLLDKNPRVGGKSMAHHVKGFTCELWPTVGLPKGPGPWRTLYQRLGLNYDAKFATKDFCVMYKRASGEWTRQVLLMDPFVPPDPNYLFDDFEFNAKEREYAMGVLTEMFTMTPEQVDALDDVSVKEWCDRHPDMPWRLRSWFYYNANAISVQLPELVAMSELQRSHYTTSMLSEGIGLPKGGYGSLSGDMSRVFEAHGGMLKLRTRVERILVKDGEAIGVITENNMYKAPIVVSNVGIQPTVLKLVEPYQFDSGYVNYVKNLVPTLGFTGMRYILSKPVLPWSGVQAWSEYSWWDLERFRKARAGEVPKDVTITMSIPTNCDPDAGPPGKQILVFGTNCSSDPEDKQIRMLHKKVDQQFEEMFPEAVPYIESKEGYVGPAQVSAQSRDHVLPGQGGEAIGVGVTIGQTGKHKPSARTPINGLFLVGCDAGASGYMGSHGAAASALNVAPMVLRYHLERKAVLWT